MIHALDPYWPIFYACLVGVSLRLSWLARKGEPLLFGAACILLTTFVASNLMHWFLRPDSRVYYAAMDGVCAVTFAMQWLRSQRPWLQIMTSLFVVSGLVHAWMGNAGATYNWDLSINIVFLLKNVVIVADALTVWIMISTGVTVSRSNKAST